VAYDLDAVLVTGAGASCPFGTPLMGAWCESLVRKLASAGPGYREATGLSVNLGPEDFERVLGEFLHQVQAWEEIRPLVPFTMGLQPGQANSGHLGADGVLPGWHNTTKIHLDKIVELIRASLYELFAGSNIKLQEATSAYSHLLTALGVTPASRLVYATTNYDTIGESALSQLGFRPDWGELPAIESNSEHQLDVTHLVDAVPRSTPVLHLHGRVGWYRRQSGEVYASYAKAHEAGYGVPIVMLPDLNKAYADDVLISNIWSELDTALPRAKRVFVLGHSLHDAPLVEAIARNVDPARVMVAIYGAGNPPNPSGGTESTQQKAIDHGWHTTLMDFGPALSYRSDQIASWLARTTD